MTKRALPALLAIAALALPASAAAEPAYTGTLDASTTEFKYSGGPINGYAATTELDDTFPCGTPGHDCEDALISVPAGGDITVKLEGTSDGAVDLDLYLFESNAEGEPGKELRASTSGESSEQVAAPKLKPGFYLVRVNAATAMAATYDVIATIKNAGAVAAPGAGPGTAPSTNAAPQVEIRVPKSARTKSLKRFRGSVSDDKGVVKVELALYKVAGKKCSAMNGRGAFKRAASCDAGPFVAAKLTAGNWSYKLRRKLKKGSYTLAARATDSEGATTTTKANFKVS